MWLIPLREMHGMETPENDKVQRRHVDLPQMHIDFIGSMYTRHQLAIDNRQSASGASPPTLNRCNSA